MSKQFNKTVNDFRINITYSDVGHTMRVDIYGHNMSVFYAEDLENYDCLIDYVAGCEESEYSIVRHYAGEAGIFWYETLSECLGEFMAWAINRTLWRVEWRQLADDVCEAISTINPH